jgi:hypothetical protein
MTDETQVRQPWTTGPWAAGRHGSVWARVGRVEPPVAWATGEAPMHDDRSTTQTDLDAIQAANARLIAQAPAMAEALAEFVRIFDRNMRRGARGNTAPVDPPEIVAARAVLDAVGWRWS